MGAGGVSAAGAVCSLDREADETGETEKKAEESRSLIVWKKAPVSTNVQDMPLLLELL